MRGDYLIKIKAMFSLLRNNKISVRKLANAVFCNWHYIRRSLYAGKAPFIIFFETSNRCNLHCVACRESQARIYDQNPCGDGSYIKTGEMPFELYRNTILEAKKYLILSVLYVNGEPLLRKDINRFIQYATDNNVATMLSTNGMLLNEKISSELLLARLDILKIAVSGFSQDVYSINHRGGNIEEVKSNIETLMKLHKKIKSHTVVIVDYILFEHNQDEVNLWKQKCNNLGVVFNVRQGISQQQPGVQEIAGGIKPCVKLCDWLWKVMTINWDGSVFPCCEYVTWKNATSLATLTESDHILFDIWNGARYRAFRKTHIDKGRDAILRCKGCHYNGIGIQG